MTDSDATVDPAGRKLVWLMICLMVGSFAFGIAMFIPAEHRAEKLEETMQRYQARRPGTDQVQPAAKKRIQLQ